MPKLSLLAVLHVALAVAGATAAPAARVTALKPASEAAWSAYLKATDTRIASELALSPRFLALDFAPNAAAARNSVLAGAIVMEPMTVRGANGVEMDVPEAMVHHWRGAVFVPGARLDVLLKKVQSGELGPKQEDVLQSRVLERGPDRMKIYLQLQRKKFVTVVYNTEHDVTFKRSGLNRASSASTATKIVEVDYPGTPSEHEVTPGDDRGFLWRWNAYWRYEQVAGGVIAECESVSLSRTIPSLLRTVVAPLIGSTARESMERTLVAFRELHRGR